MKQISQSHMITGTIDEKLFIQQTQLHNLVLGICDIDTN